MINFMIGTGKAEPCPKPEARFEYVYGENAERKYPTVSWSIEEISPKVAADMLGEHVNDRPSQKALTISEAIQRGLWAFNGATITMSRTGNLLDGRARLQACIMAGTSIDTVVVRGVPDDVDITVGLGSSRSAADQLHILGFDNAQKIALAGRALYFSDEVGYEGYLRGDARHLCVPNTELVNYVVEAYESRIRPAFSLANKVKYKGVSIRTLIVLFDEINNHSPNTLNKFVCQLSRQEPPCTTVNTLISAFVENGRKKTNNATQYTIGAWVVKAWNAFAVGEDIIRLSFRPGGSRPETYPRIVASSREVSS